MDFLGLFVHLYFYSTFSLYRPLLNSGTLKARSFKFGMQSGDDDLHCVRDNGLSRHICSFILSFFLLSIWANVKFFVKDFSRSIEARSLKLGIQCSYDELYRVIDNGLSRLISSIIFLLSIKANVKFFVKDFSGTKKARSLKLGMQSSNDDLYCVRDIWHYRLICSFVLSFLLLSI